MRLDVYLFETGLARSRTEAKTLITDGFVKISGKQITKPSFEIDDTCPEIEINRESVKYVSRGGLKLEAALLAFPITVKEKIAIDVGASSGGFTDCLLQNGAKRVIAVDSGTMQLVDSLRCDPRVTVMENYNARYMKRSDFDTVPSLAVMDVSFISATYIIPAVYRLLSSDSDFVCLVKPQFEVGKAGLSKGGIVKNEKLRREALEKVVEFAKSIGFEYISYIKSPIQGGDGNEEYLVHFRKNALE